MARKVSSEPAEAARRRANYLYEYCRTNERWQYVRFTIDHVNPAGEDSLENLALACFHCNRRKLNKTTAADSETNKIVEIFNLRRDDWKMHFAWSEDRLTIVPLTATGRATAALLELNRERIVLIREADIAVRRHPPADDL